MKGFLEGHPKITASQPEMPELQKLEMPESPLECHPNITARQRAWVPIERPRGVLGRGLCQGPRNYPRGEKPGAETVVVLGAPWMGLLGTALCHFWPHPFSLYQEKTIPPGVL